MNEFIEYFGAALLGLIGAAATYLKIRSERRETGKIRKGEHRDHEERIIKLEAQMTNLAQDMKEVKSDVKDSTKMLFEIKGILQKDIKEKP